MYAVEAVGFKLFHEKLGIDKIFRATHGDNINLILLHSIVFPRTGTLFSFPEYTVRHRLFLLKQAVYKLFFVE